jgi:hypothetical protein
MGTIWRMVRGRAVWSEAPGRQKEETVTGSNNTTQQARGPLIPPAGRASTAPAPKGGGRLKGQGESGIVRNNLSRPQYFQLAKLLEEWNNENQQVRPKFQAVAARAADALKFPVTKQNVYNTAKELGLLWKPKRDKANGLLTKAHIYNRVSTLEWQAETLRDALLNLCERIGEQPPPMLDRDEFRPAVKTAAGN